MNNAMIDYLKEVLTHAENNSSDFEIDQIAWLIGSFPKDHGLYQYINQNDHPRITKLLPEITPCALEPLAVLRVHEYSNREDTVGLVAYRILKAVRR